MPISKPWVRTNGQLQILQLSGSKTAAIPYQQGQSGMEHSSCLAQKFWVYVKLFHWFLRLTNVLKHTTSVGAHHTMCYTALHFVTKKTDHPALCYTMLHHATPCYTMLHHATPCWYVEFVHNRPIDIQLKERWEDLECPETGCLLQKLNHWVSHKVVGGSPHGSPGNHTTYAIIFTVRQLVN